MTLIIPPSTPGAVPVNAANFPGLAHFWQCNQSDVGTDRLKDVMGAADLVLPSGSTIGAGAKPYSVFPGKGITPIGSIGGALRLPTTSKPIVLILICQGNPGGWGAFNIGNNALNGVHANTSMASVLTVNGNSYAGTASTIAAAGITWGWGVLVSDWNAAEGLQTFEADDNATVNALAATSTVGASMLTEWGDAVNGYWMSGGLNGSALFGVQLWNFTVAPTPEEIKAALAWRDRKSVV